MCHRTMKQRLLDVFFYGLFMDEQLLRDKGAQATDIRHAVVHGFVLRIGARAALVPDSAGTVHGVVMKLSHSDVEKLYSEPSVSAYKPEPVLAILESGTAVAALCFNLPEAPSPTERNPEYAAKLRALAERVGLPEAYVASIR
jgi:Gamma-glutamyl cyclotransferase, AIG2-like